jgi:predicted phosphodiesterase
VLSDIHGNFHALSSVLEEIKLEGVDRIICAGDLTGPLMQNRVFEALIEKNVIMVRGNGENRVVSTNRGQILADTWSHKSYAGNRWVYEDLDPAYRNLLEFIPDQRVIKYEDTSPIRLVHGSPQDTRNAYGVLPELLSDDSKKLVRVHRVKSLEDAVQGVKESVLVCGHTHRPWSHQVGDVLVVNPGSVGNPGNGDPRADYAVLSWSNDRWSVEHKVVPYDLDAVKTQFKESGILETVGANAKTTMYCRLTGVDVALEFLLYVKKLESENSMSYIQAYSSAADSFNWGQFERILGEGWDY